MYATLPLIISSALAPAWAASASEPALVSTAALSVSGEGREAHAGGALSNAAPVVALDPKSVKRDILTLVPSSSLVTFALRDLDGFWSNLRQNSWREFLMDDAVNPFLQEVLQAFRSGVEGEFGDSGLEPFSELDAETLASIWELFQAGSATLFGGVDAQDKPLWDAAPDNWFAGLVMQHGDSRANFDDIYSQFIQLAMESEAVTHSKEHYGSVEFHVFASSLKDQTECVFVAEHDGMAQFTMAANLPLARRMAQEVVDCQRGDLAGMDSLPAYIESGRAVGFRGHAEVFANLAPLWKELLRSEGADVPMVLSEAMGELNWAVASLRVGRGENFDALAALRWPQKGFLADVSSLVGPLPMEMMDWMPHDAIQISLWNLDVYALYELALDIFAEENPEAYKMFEAQSSLVQSGMNLDYENDFLSQLSGGGGAFSSAIPLEEWAPLLGMEGEALKKAATEGTQAGGIGQCYLLGLRDTDPVEDLLDHVFGMFQIESRIQREDYKGFSINTVEEGMALLHWCYGPKFLAASQSKSAMQQVLATISDSDALSARQNKKYFGVVESHRSSCFVSLFDTVRYLEQSLGAIEDTVHMLEMLEGSEDFISFDENTAWPSAETVRKYFKGVMVSSASFKGDALVIHTGGR